MAEVESRCPGAASCNTSFRPFKSHTTVYPELEAVARMCGTIRFHAKSVMSSSLLLLLAEGE